MVEIVDRCTSVTHPVKGLVHAFGGLSAITQRCSLDREYGHQVVVILHVGKSEVFPKLDATAFSSIGLLNLSPDVGRDRFMRLVAS